jgi:hypothetical protein
LWTVERIQAPSGSEGWQSLREKLS